MKKIVQPSDSFGEPFLWAALFRIKNH